MKKLIATTLVLSHLIYINHAIASDAASPTPASPTLSWDFASEGYSSAPPTDETLVTVVHDTACNVNPLDNPPSQNIRIETSSNPPLTGTDLRYNMAEGAEALIADYRNAIKAVQDMEGGITQMRNENAVNLECLAQHKDWIAGIYNSISKVSHGISYVLAGCGTASLITDSELGLKIIILSLAALQALSQVTTSLSKTTHDEAVAFRTQVKEIIAEKKRETAAKRDELLRRGIDIDRLDAEEAIA